MKLLIVGDSPTLQTGFARVVQNLAKRWRYEFEEIHIWGIGYTGYPGNPRQERPWYFKHPFTIYPASFAGPWYSVDNFKRLIEHVVAGQYTHLFIVQDHFALSYHGFPDALRDACEHTGTKIFYYAPVDANLEGAWARIVECVDCTIAYSVYARTELERHTGLLQLPGEQGFIPHIQILPHGVDMGLYRPIPEPKRSELRAKKSKGWLKPEDILLINVNVNQRRKDVTRSLEILARLRERGGDRFKLLMHMSKLGAGDEQTDLESVGRHLGLTRGVEWEHSSELFLRHHAVLPEAELVEFYNMADGYLTTTLGEGFGLGAVEALACGLPIFLPAHTACLEVAQELSRLGMGARVRTLPLESDWICVPSDNSRMRRRVHVEGSVATILSDLELFDPQYRHAPTPEVKEWLSWDRVAKGFLHLFEQVPKRKKHYYLEYGGGLGDVFNSMYHRGSYNVLRDLQPGETATVALCCHNKFARELFENHPKRSQFRLLDLGYWHGAKEDQKARYEFGLPRPGMLEHLPEKDRQIRWEVSGRDRELIERLLDAKQRARPFFVLAASAGEPNRNLPEPLLKQILMRLEQTNRPPFLDRPMVVAVGRSYERHQRQEIPVADLVEAWFGPSSQEWFINGIDALSVPGTAALVQLSSGLITVHSALNILGWHMGVPQLLLYPESVRDRHFAKQPRDQWSFGLENGRTVHGLFSQFKEEMTEVFLNLAHAYIQ